MQQTKKRSMAQITHVNQIFESTLLPEERFGTIPPEIVESILFFTNQCERTGSVSRDWNDLTFNAAKYPNQQALEQTIPLIAENIDLDKYAQCISNFVDLQDMHQFLSGYADTSAEFQRLVLINKGLVIGILRKLSVEDREQLQIEIGAELPDSMKDIFEISTLDLSTVTGIARDKFFTLLQSYQPLSKVMRSTAVVHATDINNIEFVRLLLTDGSISSLDLKQAVFNAVINNNPELIELLLAKSSNSEQMRGLAVGSATGYNNLELVRSLLANGTISEGLLTLAVESAIEHNNLELIKLLLDHGPLSDDSLALLAGQSNNLEFIELFLANSLDSKYTRGTAAWYAARNGNLESLVLLLNNGPISEEVLEQIRSQNNDPEFVQLLSEPRITGKS